MTSAHREPLRLSHERPHIRKQPGPGRIQPSQQRLQPRHKLPLAVTVAVAAVTCTAVTTATVVPRRSRGVGCGVLCCGHFCESRVQDGKGRCGGDGTQQAQGQAAHGCKRGGKGVHGNKGY